MRDVKWMRCGVLALCLLAARGALAEGQSLRVQQPTLVARATVEHPFDEPHLAIDPRHDDHLLAAIIVRESVPTFPELLRDQVCASFVSVDGGKTWDRHDFPVTGCADPWVVFTDDGQAISSRSRSAARPGLQVFVVDRATHGGDRGVLRRPETLRPFAHSSMKRADADMGMSTTQGTRSSPA
jgi:hypothetical protein